MVKRYTIDLITLVLGSILTACGETDSKELTLPQSTLAPNSTPTTTPFQLATINSPYTLPKYPGSKPFLLPDAMTDVFSNAEAQSHPI
jgi:hypothetical protein